MIKIFTDGASRSNPGLASCAFAIYKQEKCITEYSKFLGIKTNNYAEYMAVVYALEKSIQMNFDSVEIRTDSLLVANQCNHLWKVKSQDLYPLYKKIQELKKHFQQVEFVHIPRNENTHADRLCNEILDEVNTTLNE